MPERSCGWSWINTRKITALAVTVAASPHRLASHHFHNPSKPGLAGLSATRSSPAQGVEQYLAGVHTQCAFNTGTGTGLEAAVFRALLVRLSASARSETLSRPRASAGP